MMIECRSYAKINWTLEILGRRPDGFHELRTILQSVDLHDTIRFERTDGDIEILCDQPGVPTDESNLICRAAQQLRQAAHIRNGVRATLTKRIPMAAGLGGGSSNAAVTLLACQRLWSIDLEPEELLELAAQVGSDVPFFFYGGTALGVGRGSEVYPMTDTKAEHLLLVYPNLSVPTRAAYEAWASQDPELTRITPRSIITGSCSAVFRACGSPLAREELALSQTGRNDLEPVVLGSYPELRRVFERVRAFGARTVRMAGSGSAVFAVFDSSEELEKADAALADEPWQTFKVRTVGRQEYWQTVMGQ
jgi:4-diphosphocytidyl-2-C-methyl-D-erythritol kinase